MEKDLFFYYKYIVRFFFYNKSSYLSNLNCFLIPKFWKVHLFFEILDLIDLDDPKIFNYFYLFRFFFGKKAFYSRYSTRFSLNVLYHNFLVNLVFTKKEIYFCINFFVNEIFPYLNKKNLNINFSSNEVVIYDMAIFLEKKTNIGLFSLRDSLNVTFFF